MRRKIFEVLIYCCSFLLLCSCNTGSSKVKKLQAIKTDSAKRTIQTTQIYHSENLPELLTHFKREGKLPFRVDSFYISNLNKSDSLGTSEVKILTRKWINDSLVRDSNFTDFYVIDSVKAKHVFDKWAEKLDIGMTMYANAYGLQKLQLADSTALLVWALTTTSYPACPSLYTVTIYFTMINHNNLGKSFMIGEYYSGADIPNVAEGRVSSILTSDGKLVMEEKSLTEDTDSLTAMLSHSHYEYLIHNGAITCKVKQRDLPKHIKLKK